ncbi:MAG: YgjP-like metallopeptidase domain-containing protein [Pseudomarimonas sp.]
MLVHELAHLLEPTHGDRFVALMDNALPNWRALRDGLNALPLPNTARP